MQVTLAFLALIGFVSAASNGGARSISSLVVSAIEDIRDQMPCGFPKYGIPPLAPLRIEHREVDIDTKSVKLRGSVDFFHLNGMNDFDIDQMKINAITSRVTYKFIIRNVNVDTAYDLNLYLKQYGFTVNLVGKGQMKFAIKNIVVWGTMKYSLSFSGKLKLKTLEVRTRIGEVESQIEGILGEGAINNRMNNYLAEAVEVAVNENEDMITETIENMAIPVVNSALEDVSISELIASGGNDGEKEVCIPPELEW